MRLQTFHSFIILGLLIAAIALFQQHGSRPEAIAASPTPSMTAVAASPDESLRSKAPVDLRRLTQSAMLITNPLSLVFRPEPIPSAIPADSWFSLLTRSRSEHICDEDCTLENPPAESVSDCSLDDIPGDSEPGRF